MLTRDRYIPTFPYFQIFLYNSFKSSARYFVENYSINASGIKLFQIKYILL